MFGLIDTGQGRATITELGRDALNGSARERAARVQAFLNPELFSRMYEQNKGHTLPPPAAVERQMEQMGISPKQKERARQTFVKSATYAGFIDQATGRFVKPGITARDEVSPPPNPDEGKKRNSSNDGGEPPELHPFVQGLLKELPKAGEIWPEDKRKLWLSTADSIFKMIYKDGKLPVAPLPPPPG